MRNLDFVGFTALFVNKKIIEFASFLMLVND